MALELVIVCSVLFILYILHVSIYCRITIPPSVIYHHHLPCVYDFSSGPRIVPSAPTSTGPPCAHTSTSAVITTKTTTATV